jgi:hypothetical protein
MVRWAKSMCSSFIGQGLLFPIHHSTTLVITNPNHFHSLLIAGLLFRGLSTDPLSSIADSPELPGQQSPHRPNLSKLKTLPGDRKLVIDHGTPATMTFIIIKYPLNVLHSCRVENGVERHFIGLLEKVHRPPEDFKSLRLQVVHKVFPGIPFLKKAEFIFLLNILVKVATPATFRWPYGADQ